MTCPHCKNDDWYDLRDGRARCGFCFATFDKPKQVKAEVKAESGKSSSSK